MDADGFRNYLERTYRSAAGKPLSERAAGDYVSNCRRVEMLFGLNLDQHAAGVEALARRIETLGDSTVNARVKGNLQTAVRRYYEYRQSRPGR